MVGILTVNFQSLSFLVLMHALCAHAQGSVDLHVESYGVAGPLVETLYSTMRKIDLSGYHSKKRNGNPPRMWSNTSKIGFTMIYDTFRI